MAALTTLEKARRQIFGNDPAIEADDILNQLITSSSAWVEREVGGDLMLELKTDTLDGNGGSRMLLTRSHSWRPGSPTTVVSSVKVDGVTIPARASVSSTDTNPSGWVYRTDGVDLVGYCFSRGVANVVITYMAGFTSTPSDIEQACLEHIAMRYFDRKHTGIEMISGGGEGMVNYGNAGSLAFINGTLEPYRVLGIG